jgi:hypothetical protein
MLKLLVIASGQILLLLLFMGLGMHMLMLLVMLLVLVLLLVGCTLQSLMPVLVGGSLVLLMFVALWAAGTWAAGVWCTMCVCGGSSVARGRATVNGDLERAFGSGPDLSALGVMSPSRGDVTLAPHVAYSLLAATSALTSHKWHLWPLHFCPPSSSSPPFDLLSGLILLMCLWSSRFVFHPCSPSVRSMPPLCGSSHSRFSLGPYRL